MEHLKNRADTSSFRPADQLPDDAVLTGIVFLPRCLSRTLSRRIAVMLFLKRLAKLLYQFQIEIKGFILHTSYYLKDSKIRRHVASAPKTF